MHNKIFSRYISLICVIAMLCTVFSSCGKNTGTDNEILNNELSDEPYSQTQYDAPALTARKEETVYSNASPDGTIYKTTVTDWINTDTPMVYVEDESPLKDIININSLTSPRMENGLLYWDMDTTDLHYSGVSQETPPVTFKIKYFLDGEEKSPEAMAGAKGEVKIEIKPECSLKKEIFVGDNKYEITCPMLVLAGTMLSEETFSNIMVESGAKISDGTKQMVFFAGIPGIDKSLGLSELSASLIDESMLSDTFTITANTDCFELGNIMFAAIPASAIGSFGTGEMVEGIEDIKKILTDIGKVQAAMQGLNMEQIIKLLYGDFNRIDDIMATIKNASSVYSDNEKLLKVIGSYMTKENLEKLDKLIVDLNNTDLEAISETMTDPKLKALIALMPQLSKHLSEITVLADDMNAVMPIFQSLSEDMEDPEIQESMKKMPETLKKISDVINILKENQELLNQLGSIASEDNIKQIESILGVAEQYSDIGFLSEEETINLANRMKEWLIFGNSYNIFTAKRDNMDTSVIFTYKTDAIKAPVSK